MKVGGVITGMVAAPMMIGAKAAWGQVDAVEQATLALRAYEKDGTKVNAVLSDLIGYAQSDMGVLFQRQDLFDSAQMLKLYGAETDNLSGYVQILSRSVGLGLSNWDDLNRVVGRVGSTGRLTGNDFDYLKAAGFELDDSLRNTNMTWEELFHHLDQGMPADALAGQADTIRGKTIRLQSAFRSLGQSILGVDADTSKFIEGGLGDTLFKMFDRMRLGLLAMKPAAETFGSALAAVARGIGTAIDWILKLPQPIQTAIVLMAGFGGVAMTAAGAFLLMLPRVADTVLALQRLGGLTGILGKVATALRAVTLTNPLFWVLAAAIGAVMAYRSNFLGFGRAVDRAMDTVRRAVDRVISVFGDLVLAFRVAQTMGASPLEAALLALLNVFPALRSVIEPLLGVVYSVREAFGHLRDAFEALLSGDWDAMFKYLGVAAEDAWDAVTQAFDAGIAGLQLAFEAIGRAARGIGEGIMAAVRAIDWGAVGNALLSGLESLIGWVAGFVLNLGSIAVSVAGWIADRIPDVWAWLRDTALPAIGAAIVSIPSVAVSVGQWVRGAIANVWTWLQGIVIGGTKGDGTGGPTAGNVGGVTLGDVMASVGAWVEGTIPNVWAWIKDTAIPAMGEAVVGIARVVVNIMEWAKGSIPDVVTAVKEWIGPVTVSGILWSIWLFTKDLTVAIYGDPGEPVRAKIGEIIVKGVAWAVELLSDVRITNIMKLAGYIAAAIIAAKITIAAIPVVAPFIVGLGLVFGFAALGLLLYKAVSDWALSNPLDALEVFITIALGLKEILDDLPSLSDLREHILSAIGLPEDGIIRVSIGVVFDFITGEGEDFPEQDPDVPYKDPFPNMSNFGNMGSRDLLGGKAASAGSSAFSGLISSLQSAMSQMQAVAADGMSSVNAAFTSGFTMIQTTVAGAMASATSAMTAGVTILQTTTAGAMSSITSAFRSGYTMVQTIVAGAMSSVTSAMTSGMTQLQTTAAGAMSSITSAFRSGYTQVQTTVAGAMSSITSAVRSGMTQVQTTTAGAMSSTVSATRSAFTQMQTAVAGSLSSIVSAVRSAFGQIPGIIASVGGSAAATAYSVGANIGNAMASGMRSALGAISAAANAMVAEADRAVRARARIASPSKLFMGFGEMVGEGFELGIRSMIPDAARAAAALVASPELPGLGPVPAAAYSTPGGSVITHYTDSRVIHVTVPDASDPHATARAVVTLLESDYDMMGRIK